MPVLPTSTRQLPTVGDTASAPTLSVANRTNGEAYTVAAGARSLTITVEAGATLSTTVEKSSDGTAVTVTDPATTTPDWTAPAGGSGGEACQVTVTATKGGLTSQVSWTEYTAGSGGGGGSGAAFVSARSVDLSTAANDGPHTTGSHTATDNGSDAIGYEVDRIGGSNTGTVEIVNGEGAVIDGSGSGAVAAGWDVGAVLDGESVDRAGEGARVVHVTLTDIDLTSDLILGFNTTNATSGGNFRGVRITASGAGYQVKTRANTSDGAVFASGASIPASMVVTCTIYDAHSCRFVITEGGTAPSDVHANSASPGVASRSPQTDGDYETDMLVVVGAVGSAAVTVSDIDTGDIQ